MTLSTSVIAFWSLLRVFFRFFGEGIFCYSLFVCKSDRSRVVCRSTSCSKWPMMFFAFLYSLITVVPFAILHLEAIDRLLAVALVFLYFWGRERSSHNVTHVRYGSLGWGCILAASLFSILTAEFSLTVCHTLLHTSIASSGVYDTIRGNWLLYGIYKSAIAVLHLCILFLIYKLRFLRMENIKEISVHKWVTTSFSFCLLLTVYIRYNYSVFHEIPAMAPYCDVFLWILTLMLPVYFSFYMAISKLVRLLGIKANCAADDNIFVWIFNPSMIETIHLSIYDSELFMPSFEANRIAFKKKLEKLGIDNGYKGYSEMVFCLILTKLFMGMKGWSFERDIFGQASLVIDTPFPEVRKNIEAIIEKVWLTDDSETLIDGYYLPCCNNDMYDGRERPSAEEFLMQMAKSV